MIKFPYGIADFHNIITNGYYYVDRTSYIPIIEDIGETLVFLRPRRFGKTLLLSMLQSYYDVNKADEFDRLFGHLAIGQNPTPLHNQYFILRWDFSLLFARQNASGGDIEDILFQHVNEAITQFAAYYAQFLTHPINIYPNNAIGSLQSLFNVVQLSGHKLYLLIDEYDNVANEIMMGQANDSHTRYEALVQGEGILKMLFKAVKFGLSGRGLDRVFITGISPIALTDIGSGFNVSENITFYEEFAALCGFHETDIVTMLDHIVETHRIPAEQSTAACETMRKFYNGYRFVPEQTELLYNPTLSLYFLKHLQRTQQFPSELLDTNLEMDLAKLRYLSRLPYGDETIINIIAEEQPFKIPRFSTRFGLSDLVHADSTLQFFGSILYYMGVVTLAAEKDVWDNFVLIVPNQVTRQLYYDHIRMRMLPASEHPRNIEQIRVHFYQTGDLSPLCEFVNSTYLRAFDNRDYRWSNELAIKIAFVTLLSNPDYYITETESRVQRDYCDLLMLVRSDKRHTPLQDSFFEFKYISLHDLKLEGKQVQALSQAEAMALPLVQTALSKAESAIAEYRPKLLDRYREVATLHCYAVVGLGFDKVVWKKVES